MIALRSLLQVSRIGSSGRNSRGGYRKQRVSNSNAGDRTNEGGSRLGSERLFSALGEDMKHTPGGEAAGDEGGLFVCLFVFLALLLCFLSFRSGSIRLVLETAGSWQSAAQLVAGTTVGAGILALPTVSSSTSIMIRD